MPTRLVASPLASRLTAMMACRAPGRPSAWTNARSPSHRPSRSAAYRAASACAGAIAGRPLVAFEQARGFPHVQASKRRAAGLQSTMRPSMSVTTAASSIIEKTSARWRGSSERLSLGADVRELAATPGLSESRRATMRDERAEEKSEPRSVVRTAHRNCEQHHIARLVRGQLGPQTLPNVEHRPHRLVDRAVDSGVGGEPRDGAAQRLELRRTTSFDVEEEAGLHGPRQCIDVGARVRALVVRQGHPPGARNGHDLHYRALDESAATRRLTNRTNGRASQPAHRGHGADEHELLPQLDFHGARGTSIDSRVSKH